MSNPIRNIVLLGAGNMATVLGKGLHGQGFNIVQVYNRTLSSAQVLAQQLECASTDQLQDLDQAADLYILCVSDIAIEQIVPQLTYLEKNKGFLVHTSGATPSTVLASHFTRYGVFYPLQSLSKTSPTDLTTVPFCLDAPAPSDLLQLEVLARHLSQKVYLINDQQRSRLHVAAVFVNNFSNHLYHLMDQWLAAEQVPFELLHPLILGGAQKVRELSPRAAQTGPAIRGDQNTIRRHLEILEKTRPDLAELYRKFTESINPDLPSS